MSILDPVGQSPNMNETSKVRCSRFGTGSRSVAFVARLLSFVKVACAGRGSLVVIFFRIVSPLVISLRCACAPFGPRCKF